MIEFIKVQIDYWQQHLSGYEALILPIDYPRSNQQDSRVSDSRVNDYRFELDSELSAQLRELATKKETTLYGILLSGFYVTLATLSGQKDIVIGTLSGNHQPVQSGLPDGFFINRLALRTEISPTLTIDELIDQVQQVVIQGNLHQELPFEELMEALGVECDPARHPIFQVMFGVQCSDDMAVDTNPHFGQANENPVQGSCRLAKLDLSLFLTETQSQLEGNINYAAGLFDESTIARITAIYQRVLQAFVANSRQSIARINRLSEEERYTLLHTWNQTDKPYPQNKTLHQLFERQVVKTPNRTALVFEGERLTYLELNEKANQLAHVIRANYSQLKQKPFRPGTLIVIYADRGLEIVISILAVLKAGGAYVPLPPEHPKMRTRFILSDTQASLILTQQRHLKKLREWTADLAESFIFHSIDNFKDATNVSTTNPESINTATDLAYVIYTSGTTGNPKGVMVEHKAVCSFVFNNRYIDSSTVNNVASLSPYSFDGFVFDAFFTLLNGACIYLLDKQVILDFDLLSRQLSSNNIDSCFITTALFNQLVESGTLKKTQVRNLLFGGEKADLASIQKALCDGPHINIVHVYGPTETVVFASAYHFDKKTEAAPIGRALNNKRFYVLDPSCNPVPIGTPGELHIGGAGLARGYLNRVELTQKCFIDNPFANKEDKSKGYTQLYKTGDIVRWLPDGILEFLARNDFQVKLRGYRIELGEIESALAGLYGVKQAVVLDRDQQGVKYLAAYLVTEPGDSIDVEAIRKNLSASLPEYMLPDTFTFMSKLPLTINGKLDRRALPEPEFTSGERYVAPGNDIEEKLCTIWQDLLELEQVGIHDNYFRMGGNSITAIRLAAACRRDLGVDVPLALLFEQKTVAGLAAHMNQQEMLVIPKGEAALLPLSFAQESLLFIEQYEQGTDAYHIPYLIKLEDSANISGLETALRIIINRHSVLNTIYLTNNDGDNFQQVKDQLTGKDKDLIQKVSLTSENELFSTVRDEIARPFDLTNEISIRLRSYSVGESNFFLFLWHHIAFDGWSMDLFFRELAELYEAISQGNEPQLPAIDISYGDYAQWQRQYLRDERMGKLLDYWQQHLSDYETLALPTDHPRPGVLDYRGMDYGFELQSDLSNQLRELAKAQETTLYSVLLSGFYVTLATLSGQTDIVIGTPSDNRQHAQTQSLIGYFVNSLVLRIEVKPSLSIDTLIRQVHQVVTLGKIHQELPFEKMVDALQVDRDPSRHPVFQVMFGVQNFADKQVVAGLPFEPVEVNSEQSLFSSAKFDLSLFLNDAQPRISGEINFAISLFDEATIERISAIYVRVLQGFVVNSQQSIDQIAMLSDEERKTLLYTWNETDAPYPQDKTLHQLFEGQVEKTPNNIALVYENQNLTYRQLNENANQLAHVICTKYSLHHRQSIQPDTLIALYLDRSPEMVISILAVLKAGGTYVPLSPEYPKARVQFILDDTQSSIILTQQHYLKILEEWSLGLSELNIFLAADIPGIIVDAPKINPPPKSTATDLAYVIYTSGTTGKPKGVMVEHRNAINTIVAMREVYEITQDSRKTACFSNYVFDVSVSEIFNSLSFGGELHLFSQEIRTNLQLMGDYILEHRLNFLFLPPAALALLPKQSYPSLRTIIFAGERCDPESCSYWAENYALHNYYGPTETTVYASGKRAIERNLNEIGQGIKNARLYVLNDNLQTVPIGTPAELYIGGAGVARGYLNRAELTQALFINNPFANEEEKEKGYTRLYKTGDIVRWLPDGNLEYIGRNDFQVKIRGYRIELGEIESVLGKIPGIRQAVVLDRDRLGTKYLAAYLVTERGDPIEVDGIRENLLAALPEYMIPNTFIFLELLPLTVNGKLDRRALPEPEFVSGENYVAPRNETEEKLCKIWQDLLGLERVGIYDNYFRIGGNSITAIRLTTASRRDLVVDIPLALLFGQKTVAGIVAHLNQQEMVVIQRSEVRQLPLSFAQERLLFIERYEQGTNAYHIPYFVQLRDNVNLSALETAFNILLNRHLVLRTVYLSDGEGKDYQQVIEVKVAIQKQCLAEKSQLMPTVKTEIARPFDLTTEISLRLCSYAVEQSQYLLILWHHIAFDGWSVDLFMQELAEVYEAVSQGNVPQLPVIDIDYGDYAIWQRQYLQGKQLENLLSYWQQHLAGYETLALPTDHQRPKKLDYLGKDYSFKLESDLSTGLRELARMQETTLFSVLLSGFYVTLANLSGQTDIVIGTPSDNRQHAQTQSLVGFFVNSLVLRTEVLPTLSIGTFISRVHQVVTQGQVHQELPFEKLVDALRVERDLSRHPIFQVMFGVQNFGGMEAGTALPFEPVNINTEQSLYSSAKFDLSLFLSDSQSQIGGEINYALSLFEETTIERILSTYQRVLKAFVADSRQSIAQVELLSEDERHRLLHTWTQTDTPYPQDKTLHQVFEEQVENTPHSIALVFEDRQLTYGELNEKANQLAHVIRANYEQAHQEPLLPDTLIALYFDRSLEMVIAILAVLKAGGAYVPLSPEYPKARVQLILNDTQSPLILTQQQHLEKLEAWVTALTALPCYLAVDNPEITTDKPTTNPTQKSTAKDLAYVIYTSGTTGKPKGVMVSHQNLSAYFTAAKTTYQINSDERVLQFSSISFDIFVEEMFSTLLSGASLVFRDEDMLLGENHFWQFIKQQSVTVLSLPTAFWNELCAQLDGSPLLTGRLRLVIVGGESMSVSMLKRWRACVDDKVCLLNTYGPTESTVVATAFDVSDFQIEKPSIPIGKSLPNTQCYVLNDARQLCPVAFPGELYIGGAGVARGYLNRKDLTRESFIGNPFASKEDKTKGYNRLYRTGDRARWLPDGNLEFLGRMDFQVKIRGYRVELGEIESALSKLPGVKQAVVLERDKHGTKYLAAYLVTERGEPIEVEASRGILLTTLPEYMLPNTFTFLESLPLTVNGKLDRRALPEPEFVSGENYVAPRNETEEKLCKIWQELLGLERVGIYDNYFRIGGNSIAAIRLTTASRRELGVDIPLALLFEQKTVAGIAPYLNQQEMLIIPQSEVRQLPLSFAQERLLFIERYEQGTDAYHIPYFVKLRENVNLSALEVAFNNLINRHSVLRTVYLSDGEGEDYQQVIEVEATMQKQCLAEKSQLMPAVRAEIAQPFDLTNEISLRLCSYAVGESRYLLVLWHHIAFDGWSTKIFLHELNEIYQALSQKRQVILAELDIGYSDYAIWQRQYLQGSPFENLLHYWQQHLAGYETLALPTDYPRPSKLDYRGRGYVFELDSELSTELRELAKLQETTLYSVLLSGFYITLATLSGQTDIVIGTASDNRHHVQTQSLIGFFVNSLALRTEVSPSLSIDTFISQVHQVVTQGQVHQELPFEKLVDALQVERDLSRHPIFQVMFGVQSFDDMDVDTGLPFEPVNIDPEQSLYSAAKFDLSLALDDTQTQVCGEISYALSLFEEATIERISSTYQRVLQAFVANSQQSIAQIEMLSEDERYRLLNTWNQTDAPYPQDKTLHQAFEEQVEKTPHGIALVFEDRQLMYGELNEKTNQLAHVIRSNYQHRHQEAFQPDTLIALYFDRSPEMVISILAVLKAGGAYVPISPEYPKARTQFILSDTQTRLILTQHQHQDKLGEWAAALVGLPDFIATDDPKITVGIPEANLNPISTPNDLAYVIYTSGTTGKPKGVMVEQHSVSNLVFNQTQIMNFNTSESVLWLADYIFDASVEQLFLSLINGASLHIPSSLEIRDTAIIKQKIVQAGITHLHATPSYLSVLGKLESNASLRRVICAGESCVSGLKQIWGNLLVNKYGPTETTITSTECINFDKRPQLNCIGIPIFNTQVYILSESQKIVPVGTPGELCIGGVGVARGYLNRLDLTEEKFIDNPFASDDEKEKGYTRLYKTGDIVRWLPDGNLEYLGRMDFQVKIRGYRIEPGEIESVLVELPEVKQSVVLDCDWQGTKYLVAYLVTEHGQSINVAAIRKKLLAKLPEYMLPGSFNFIDSIPLTLNGKLDRRALPEPEFVSGEDYVAPRNEIEKKLCSIWQDLLGLEKVGIYDNYFRIGGNSITAIRLTSASRRELGRDIPLVLLFEQKTIAGIVAHLNKQEMINIPRSEEGQLPLSFAQERLLFIERFEQGSQAYHIPYFVRLREGVKLSDLEAAFNILINRHQVLKTIYLSNDDDDDYQQVLDVEIVIQEEHLDSENELLPTVKAEIARPFNLTTEISVRLHFFEVEQCRYLLILWHHIAFDGWSTEIFLQEFAEIYQALSHKRQVNLPDLDIGYSDYAIWQRQYLQGKQLENLQHYWQQRLAGYETLALPTDYPRPSKLDYRGKDYGFKLESDLSTGLRQLAKSQETTLYSVLLSGLYVTLATLSGQKDIIIGTPSDNRQHAQTQSLIGFFVNSLALRTEVSPSLSIDALISRVHQAVTQGQVHQELPFEKLVDALQVERDPSRHPIFQVMFGVQNFGNMEVGTDLPFEPVNINPEQSLYSSAKFDLSLVLDDAQTQIGGEINYALSLFKDETIERISSIYQRVLRAFVANSQQSIVQIEMLSEEERYRLLHTWNQTDAPYPQDKTLHQVFEEQVEKKPHSIALVFEDRQLTYGGLNEKANQLAHVIRTNYEHRHQKPFQQDTLIALYLDRGLEMVISILAVLKAGGAYVPLSPEYPKARTQFILSDTLSPLIVTQQQHLDKLEEWATALAGLPGLLAVDNPEITADKPTTNPIQISTANNLAYVIYTSGTTGNPKGVMVEHKAVCSFAFNNRYIKSKNVNKVASLSPYSFDGFVFDAFFTLLNGACFYLMDKQLILDFDLFSEQLSNNNIDSCFITTALFNQLAGNGTLKKTKVNNLLFGGEKADLNSIKKAIHELDDINIVHVYGPTETVVFASAYHFGQQVENAPIGKPLNNKRFYVLDCSGNPAPIGTPGELCVGGAGLARGYLNSPELTRERFIDNPFANKDDIKEGYNRLYKTGDIVRWLDDGNLEYIDRTDAQVKIRGFRIELGEIENQLAQMELVKSTVVLAHENELNQKHLVAYVVRDADVAESEITENELHEKLTNDLQAVLPDYMIPSIYVVLDTIPLTTNGKVDKRALPEPKLIDFSEYVAPKTETEKLLAQLWNDLLNVESLISIHANFFKLGGHSLLATKMASRINLEFSVEIKLREIFLSMTIEKIGKTIDAKILDGELSHQQRVNAFHKDSGFDMEEFEL